MSKREEQAPAMHKTTINIPLDLVVAARRLVADNPTGQYQDVLRRWMRIGMEAEAANTGDPTPKP